MLRMSRLLAFFFLVILAGPVASAAEPEWDARVVTGELGNGLRYFIHDSGKAGEPFNIRLIVHAGSADEQGPSGLAHGLEHMVFQSTKDHPETLHRYFQKIGWRTGVQINALTRETETQFMVRTRPDDALDLDQSLAFLADMMLDAQLLQEDWDKERFVVLEEMRRGEGAASRLSRQKKELLRVGSRFVGRPTIGTLQDVEAMTAADMRDFYDRFYVASNMSVVISGRVDPQLVIASLERHFGPAESKPRPDRSYLVLPLKDTLTTGLVQDPAGSSSQVTYAFRVKVPPRISEAGQRAYLEKYFLSKLMREEMQEQAYHYARDVDSLTFVVQETTEERLVLAFNARTNDHDRGWKILLEAVERLRRDGLDEKAFEELMARARRINQNNIKAAESRTFAEWEDKITSAVLTNSVLDAPAAKSRRTALLLDQITLEGLNERMGALLAVPDQVLFYQVPGGQERVLPQAGEVAALREQLATVETLPELPPIPEAANTPEDIPLPEWPEAAQLDRDGKIVATRESGGPNVMDWTLSNGDRLIWLERPTPDGKVYLSGRSAPGYMNAEFGSALSQAALQLWEQSGFSFWSQQENERWSKDQAPGWSWALKDGVLDIGLAMDPEKLPELAERYAAMVRFGFIREEAVADLAEQTGNASEDGQGYSEFVFGDTAARTGVESLRDVSGDQLATAAEGLINAPVEWFAVGPAPQGKALEDFVSVIGALSRSASLTPAPALQRPGVHQTEVRELPSNRAEVKVSFFAPRSWTPEDSFLLSTITPLTQEALKTELRYELGGVYSTRFELELDPDTDRIIGTLSFVCDPARSKELVQAALGVLKRMPETVLAADLERIRSDIAFAEETRLRDPNTWLRRLALSYRRYGDAGYLDRMTGLGAELTADRLAGFAREAFQLDNLSIMVRLPKDG